MKMLYQPYRIKNVELKNRIVMSPMCQYSAPDNGHLTEWHQVHYTSRAVGGVGLVMLEATAVHPEGRISSRDLGIWSDQHVAPLHKLVQSIHTYQAKAAIQLAHAGRKAELSTVPLAPSAVAFSEKYQVPKALTNQEIAEIVQQFAEAARRAKEAGFDIVEIHAAHGYLLNQFLSPLANHRVDQYGGSLENRMRFLQEVVQAVKEVWSGPLFVRFSAEEYAKGGNHIEDYVQIVKQAKEWGVDLADVSSGAVVPHPIEAYPGYQVPFAERIRREAGIATGAVGLITSAEQAEQILCNGSADLIFMGRELLRNPYWPLTHLPIERRAEVLPVQYARAFT